MVKPGQPLPVTVVGGFLGSGKTTLINHILRVDHGLRVAVMVNDFGAVNVDAALVTGSEGGVYSLANGCICCNLNQHLADELEALLRRPEALPAIDHIVIEASGAADPARIMDTVRYARFARRLRPDAVVVLVDVASFNDALSVAPSLAAMQLDAADLVVLNKMDLATPETVAAWRNRWNFPDIRIIETVNAAVPFELLFGEIPERRRLEGQGASHDQGHSHDHAGEHTHATYTHGTHEPATSAIWHASGPVSLNRLQRVLKGLPPEIYRAKGILRDDTGRRVAVHLVGRRLDFTAMPDQPTGSAEAENMMVLIGFGKDLPLAKAMSVLDEAVIA